MNVSTIEKMFALFTSAFNLPLLTLLAMGLVASFILIPGAAIVGRKSATARLGGHASGQAPGLGDNREIAERLFVAEQTVKNYVTSIYAKQGRHCQGEGRLTARSHPAPSASRYRSTADPNWYPGNLVATTPP
jgi:Bacterial regulatory proteins, luxR family